MQQLNPTLGRALVAVLMLTMVGKCVAAAEPDKPADALVINGENTVIITYDVYAHLYLHYFLNRCVAKHPDHESYRPHIKPQPDYPNAPVFPIVKTVPAGKQAIVMGPWQRIPEAYLDDADRERFATAKPGSILIKRNGNNIILAHNRDPWFFSHINTFLDHWAGVRMYAPDGADGLHWISDSPSTAITINKLDHFKQPYLAKADFASPGHERNRFWLRINSIQSEGSKLRANHGIIRFFDPEIYHAKHPELYPMGEDGTRPRPIGDAWNPCLAQPELASKVAMNQVRKAMAAKRKPTYLSFGVMDCHYVCACPTCQASMKKNNGAGTLWYDFMNRVAKQCQKEFPGLYLTSYAYSNVNTPQGIHIEPNIVIDNVIKSYNYTNPRHWEGERDEIMSYASLGASWVTHDWNFQGVTPRIYSRRLATFLQWGVQNGMLGMYSEWSGREYWYLTGAYYWIVRKLHSDPYQDPDMLWRQYCQDMYGDGWEVMYRFYDMFQQKHVVSDRYHVRQDWPREEVAAFTEADVAQQRAWLESAMAATRDDAMIQKRLAAVMRYFRAHELLVKATAEPARLYHQYTVLDKGTGINRAALEFYVNDDGRYLREFDYYYENSRTRAPDSNAEDRHSGMRFSYRNNYSRALGTIIKAVTAQAMEGVDLKTATYETLVDVRQKATRIYHDHLPASYRQDRAVSISKLMAKILWIPHGEQMPKFDGKLDDAAWESAQVLDGWTLADLLLPSAEGNKTEGRIMRVGDHLVVGVTCQQPNGIWAETPADIETGTRIWRETSCEFFFGPPVETGKKQEFVQYIVNSLGAFRGFRKAKDNRKDVHCGVKVADDGKSYTIEFAMPLKVDGMYNYADGQAFTFNIMRNPFYGNSFNSRERIGWAPIFFTAGRPESRGLVVLAKGNSK